MMKGESLSSESSRQKEVLSISTEEESLGAEHPEEVGGPPANNNVLEIKERR